MIVQFPEGLTHLQYVLAVMAEQDSDNERDFGAATIVYQHPAEGLIKKTVPNEHIAYFQDHWIIKNEEDEQGNDIVRRIPVGRVHYVERSVEEFEEEIKTVRTQVQSVADSLKSKFFGEEELQVSPVEIETEDADNGR